MCCTREVHCKIFSFYTAQHTSAIYRIHLIHTDIQLCVWMAWRWRVHLQTTNCSMQFHLFVMCVLSRTQHVPRTSCCICSRQRRIGNVVHIEYLQIIIRCGFLNGNSNARVMHFGAQFPHQSNQYYTTIFHIDDCLMKYSLHTDASTVFILRFYYAFCGRAIG